MKHSATIVPALLIALAAGGGAAAAQGRPGSIYDPDHGPRSMIADKTARRPGDLLTVIISETQKVDDKETSTISKSTNLDYALTSFNLKPSFFSVLPDVTAESKDDFNGTANYKKDGTFQARITVIVMDALPNGNLVVQGRRELRVDREVKVIEFSGLVRSYDVKPDNTVLSELVAEARIAYSGAGPLTDGTNRKGLGSVLHGLISWIWPF
ncbi:MAG: flagellar basal body L-ring protein FlgH [Planctomycetota bacterium]